MTDVMNCWTNFPMVPEVTVSEALTASRHSTAKNLFVSIVIFGPPPSPNSFVPLSISVLHLQLLKSA